MNKKAIIYPALTVATAAAIGVSSYKANQQGTETAEGPATESIVRNEPVQGMPFALYGQAENFNQDAAFMIENMRPTITREDRAERWGEIADVQERTLDAYTDTIRSDPNSSFAKLAQLRIDSLYIDPVFQEADAGDIIHAGCAGLYAAKSVL